ncbi:PREDICTED: uncharacterized protein LOC105363297, partial [Ceratosolen solmsi marchali]|uniref:Uncharacterized protein LOC105363297 n=1 Tax=Ceratosolen solmsi marchali TaxID=326594 RepID=A0AAJ6YJM9_9HYME
FQDENVEREVVKISREVKKKNPANENDSVGLGVAQIVITAATPMEEVDRPFPGIEEVQEEDELQNEENPQEQQKQESKPAQEQHRPNANKPEVEAPPSARAKLKMGESEDKSIMDDQPTDSAPFPISSSSGSDADSTSTDEVVPTGKMLLGGRASIPDELQPDQLQKLQNLKESNA